MEYLYKTSLLITKERFHLCESIISFIGSLFDAQSLFLLPHSLILFLRDGGGDTL